MCDDDDKYKQKFHLLSARCESIQTENEQIARQVVKTKKNLRKARRLRMRLLHKLDEIGDPWRQGQVKGISLKGQGGIGNSAVSSSKAQQQVFALMNQQESTPDGKKLLSNSISTSDLECSPAGMAALPDLGSDSISMSEASALVSTLNMSNLPMLPMSVSPTPSPFADHDLLTGDSLSSTMH